MKKILAAVLVSAAGLASTTQAQLVDISQPNTTLASVIGRQFIVGDKLFTMPSNAFQSAFFNANQIFISPLSTSNPNQGLGFRLTGAFNDAPGGGGTDFVLQYTVEITPAAIAQGLRFTDADLRFNGAATGNGSYARVDETVMNQNNNILGNHSVWAIGGGTTHLDDHFLSVRGLTKLKLVKDVQFFANGANGTATASFVDQAFSQVVIPLPTTGALAAAGLGALAIRRRRR